MRSAVLASVLAFALAVTACGGGSSPIAPSPAASVPALSLTPAVDELPVGGGTVTITVATAATNVPVSLSASSGTLSANAVRTDSAGRAEVFWTGSSSATVTGSAAGGETIASIRVAVPPVPEPEPTPPNPTPTPAPPRPTPPTPAHDVLGVTVFYNVGAESTTPIVLGAAVFALDGQPVGPLTYAWDFEADGTIDSTEATPSRRFAAGTHPVVVTVRTADGRSGTGTITVSVIR